MRNRWWTLVALLFAAAGAAGQSAESRPAFNPSTADLRHATADWIVWTTAEMVGDPQRHVRTYRTRYWRENRRNGRTDLAYEMTGTRGSDNVATVLPDGTVALAFGRSIVWAVPREVAREEPIVIPGGLAECVAGYPDGVVARVDRADQTTVFHFVPIADRKLDVRRAVQMSGEEGVSMAMRVLVARDGSRLGWMAPVKEKRSSLTVFDLGSRERTRHDFPESEQTESLLVLDGNLAMTDRGVYEVSTGRRLAQPRSDAATSRASWLTLRRGVLYGIRPSGERLAICAAKLGGQPAVVRDLFEFVPYALYDSPRGPMNFHDLRPILDPGGITVWNGKGWSTVQW